MACVPSLPIFSVNAVYSMFDRLAKKYDVMLWSGFLCIISTEIFDNALIV